MLKKILIVIVLIPLLLFFYAIGRKDLTLPKATVKAKYSLANSHFINWKGGEFHYTESGSGVPVLMIHGFGGSNRDFYILDSLVNSKYRVIRVDLPGFGLSDFPEQNEGDEKITEVYSEYFSFLLDTLHIDSCYVLGNSLGGLMSVNLTLQHPDLVKKLILFNSAGYDMAEVMKTANASFFQGKLVQLMLEKGIPKYMTAKGIGRVFYKAPLLTEEKIQRVNDFWNREGNLHHIMAMASTKEQFDESLIKKISCPTLIVWGKEDKIVNPKYAERFHHDIKGSQVIIYDSCGHVPMMERPLDVQREVLRFLSNTTN